MRIVKRRKGKFEKKKSEVNMKEGDEIRRGDK
jgi:hypothetical protein